MRAMVIATVLGLLAPCAHAADTKDGVSNKDRLDLEQSLWETYHEVLACQAKALFFTTADIAASKQFFQGKSDLVGLDPAVREGIHAKASETVKGMTISSRFCEHIRKGLHIIWPDALAPDN
ncbi:hypothetical protein [Rhizobium tumorigenes]|uniref:Uncharacterized protein n=1 Tax=Rhizobium tumorigenes TaxID=2041385 RepID=A0AAF1KP23_9HYPH|nr:hypothetical protein [Rhizobium tumorigenes]WFR98733.1 hypothetical protein PR017_23825 [Rhizobium tumorigenes]